MRGVVVDGDAVDDATVDQVFERPHEVGQVNAVHRRAEAHVAVEEHHRLVRMAQGEAAYEVEFGADRPCAARGGVGDGLDDELRRPDEVGLLDHLVAALRVHEHLNAGHALAHVVDALGGEAAVHGAMATPQDHLRRAQLVGGERGSVGIPHDAVVERETEVAYGGIAAQVLVGQEQHALTAFERPLERPLGVARCADRSVIAPGEGLDVGGGVHVGDGNRGVGKASRGDGVPGGLDLVDRGHVGHRAPGGEIGQDHLLVVGGEDVGALGHEVHAAEDDELGLGMRGRLLRQLERVAGGVGELDDLVALIVMAEDVETIAQRRLGGRGPRDQVGIAGGGQVARALDTALAARVGAVAQQEQGERRGRGLGERHEPILPPGGDIGSGRGLEYPAGGSCWHRSRSPWMMG